MIVRKRETAPVSKGGIIIPDEARKPTHVADVLYSGVEKYPAGHVVLTGRYSGIEVIMDGESLWALTVNDKVNEIYGVFND